MPYSHDDEKIILLYIQAIRCETTAERENWDPDTQYADVCGKYFVTGKSNIQVSVLGSNTSVD